MNILDQMRQNDESGLNDVILRRGSNGDSYIEMTIGPEFETLRITRRRDKNKMRNSIYLRVEIYTSMVTISHWSKKKAFLFDFKTGLDKPMYIVPRLFVIYKDNQHILERYRTYDPGVREELQKTMEKLWP